MDIVQHQEFVLAAMVGKGKAARNVLLRKDVGELIIISWSAPAVFYVNKNNLRHGTCSGPGDCLCKPGWRGPLCDQVNMV